MQLSTEIIAQFNRSIQPVLMFAIISVALGCSSRSAPEFSDSCPIKLPNKQSSQSTVSKRLPTPKGMVVVELPATFFSTVHGFIQPGSRVDVVGIHKVDDDPSITESRIFLENVLVLQIKEVQQSSTHRVVFAVDSKLKDRLLQAASGSGRVWLMLRKPGKPEEEPDKEREKPVQDQCSRSC